MCSVRVAGTPGRTPEQLSAAEHALLGRHGRATLPVPLLRVLAQRPATSRAVG